MARYEERIKRGLTRVWKRLGSPESIDLRALRMIIFSDHHRGAADGADDFLPCTGAYHAALRHYRAEGYTLYLLGDVEEFWESRPTTVMTTYARTLELEHAFVDAGRLRRIAGNHDDLWYHQSEVDRLLKPYIADGDAKAEVLEGHRVTVEDAGRALGELFFIHGHQGTTDADRFARFSRLFVRFFWRPFQRLTKIKSTTPATDFALRLRHERAMHRWASDHAGVILITGHTHHPVFSSESHESYLRSVIAKLTSSLAAEVDPARRERLKALLEQKTAHLARILERCKGAAFDPAGRGSPCVFNTGCCSFADGDITGIEIADCLISLVRWRLLPRGPYKKVLREDNLRAVLEQCC